MIMKPQQNRGSVYRLYMYLAMMVIAGILISSPSPVPTAESAQEQGAISFAVIGDYGSDDSHELAVANLVKSWNPEFIITLGDNNYPDGEAATIDANIGKYYREYIYPYRG